MFCSFLKPACIVLASFASAAFADSEGGFGPLVATTNVEGHDADAYVVSMLSTFSLLGDIDSVARASSETAGPVNLHFASGNGFIVDQRLTRAALVIFDDDAVAELTKLPTNSDTCYVQTLRFQTGKRLVLAVHNDDQSDPEDVFRCLVAGLWKYQGRELAKLDTANWRQSFVQMLRSRQD